MSSTSTTRLGLIKPTPGSGEPVNVATQINDSWDRIDAAVGVSLCTSSTRPPVPFDGQLIYETDTTNTLVWNAGIDSWDFIGVVSVSTYSALTSLTGPEGMVAYVKDTDVLYIRNESSWRPRGQASVSTAANLTNIANAENGFIAVARDTATPYIRSGSQWLRPSGKMVAENIRTTPAATFTTTETILDSVTFAAVAGESYRINYDSSIQSTVAGDVVEMKMRWVSGNSITATGGTVVRRIFPSCALAGKGDTQHMEKVITPNVTGNVTVGVSAVRGVGTGTISSFADSDRQNNVLQVYIA